MAQIKGGVFILVVGSFTGFFDKWWQMVAFWQFYGLTYTRHHDLLTPDHIKPKNYLHQTTRILTPDHIKIEGVKTPNYRINKREAGDLGRKKEGRTIILLK